MDESSESSVAGGAAEQHPSWDFRMLSKVAPAETRQPGWATRSWAF